MHGALCFRNIREVHFSGAEHVRGNVLGHEFTDEQVDGSCFVNSL